jgi:hypothetical protein
MRIAVSLIATLCSLPLVLSACSDDKSADAEPFDTLQDCFTDHHSGAESLPAAQAITVCCLDHPIAGVHPSCKDNEADCVAHVDAELDATVTATDIQAACADYVKQK